MTKNNTIINTTQQREFEVIFFYYISIQDLGKIGKFDIIQIWKWIKESDPLECFVLV